jgi:hypothetical protein
MRYLFLITLTIVCMSVAKKASQAADFKVIRAEKQTFYGGVAGSPVVTTYTLIAKSRIKQIISVDSGWAEGKADQALILLDSGKTCQKKKVKIGEIIKFQVQIKTASNIGGGDNQWQMPGSVESKSPARVKNSLCIRYKSGKNKYLTISMIKTIPPILGQ